MGPLPWSEPDIAPDDVESALDLVDEALVRALAGSAPVLPPLESLSEGLRTPAGVFVTLTVDGELNGCIGSVEAREPLGHAAPRLALAAAFADPRLPPLLPADYRHLTIELSLLSPLRPIAAASRTELLAEVRPYDDGIVVATCSTQALFLPAVWEQLPDPEVFLDHLWLKAGIPPRTWPPDLRVHRFAARRHRRRAGAGRASAA